MRYFYAVLFIVVGTIALTLRPNKPRMIVRDGETWCVAPGCMLYTFPEAD